MYPQDSILSDPAREIALAIWQEQLELGLGGPSEAAGEDNLDLWLDNRTYDLRLLEEAAAGDVGALAAVRTEAGLPVFR